ncbi:MAG TPA: hypothetical protein VMF58_18975 [Rhizomicrobium sp.]|nr:hypothetical protein [Rhizomicrobium sp.]
MYKAMFGGIAGLLLSAAAASAATHIALDGYCNNYAIRHGEFNHYAIKDTGCSAGFGGGLLGSIKGVGKQLILALQDPSSNHTQFEFIFSYPLVTGGSWELYDSTDGVTFNALAGGTYTVGTPAARSTRSATAKPK